MTREPTIVLVNQISRHGHLDTYAKLYSRCLLDLGYRVVLLAEHDPHVSEWLLANGQDVGDRFSFFSRDQLRLEMERERQLRLEQERQLRLEQERQLRLEQELKLRLEQERRLRFEQERKLQSQQERQLHEKGTQLRLMREHHQASLYARISNDGDSSLRGRFERFMYTLMVRYPVLARARLVWRTEGLIGIFDRVYRYSRWLVEIALHPFKRILDKLEHWLPILTRIRRLWRTEGLSGFLRRVGSYIWRLLHKIFSAARIDALLPRFVNLPEAPSPGVNFGPIVDEIRAAERLFGIKPALVLFLYLDMMSEGRDGCSWLESHLDAPWAGILFHPRVVEGDGTMEFERYFRCSNAKGAVFLNPASIDVYRKELPKLSFETVPDVTEAAMSPGAFEIIRQLRERARGRTIVLQFGTLGPHKGIMDLVDVIGNADPRLYFFAIVGEMFWDSYEPADVQKLRDFFAAPPENCLVHFGYLDDERELNTLINAADILYSVYRGVFRDSSNTLTKAAIFEKPVLVSDQFLVGERVRNYRLGAAVQSGDPKNILAGLESVRVRPKFEFGFAAYRQDHSTDALKSALSRALPSWHGPLS